MRIAVGKFRKTEKSQQPTVEGVAAPTSVSASRANDYDENHPGEIATCLTEDHLITRNLCQCEGHHLVRQRTGASQVERYKQMMTT